jgi:glycosyltransferase involved in cell wall biosynthesis
LMRHVAADRSDKGSVIVVENAIDKAAFRPRDRKAARARFNLPQDAVIVGTAGALSSGRGIGAFYDAFTDLAGKNDRLAAAVAGPRDTPVPQHPRLYDAGHLGWPDVPVFLSALDIGVVCNKDSLFARHCFPQKAYEMLACGLPVVGANVGVMSDLLATVPECLFEPNNAASLADALERTIGTRSRPEVDIPSWEGLATRMEAAMRRKVLDISTPAGS